MPRVKIALPDSFPFVTEMTVRVSDINYGGHLGNDTVLSLVHEARVRYLQQHGYSETDIEGSGIIMTDATVVYRSEGFRGDVIVLEVAARKFSGARCEFVYRLSNKATGREIARATTGIATYDYHERRGIPMPEAFRRKFEASGTL